MDSASLRFEQSLNMLLKTAIFGLTGYLLMQLHYVHKAQNSELNTCSSWTSCYGSTIEAMSKIGNSLSKMNAKPNTWDYDAEGQLMENVIKYEYCDEESNSLMFLAGYGIGDIQWIPRQLTDNKQWGLFTQHIIAAWDLLTWDVLEAVLEARHVKQIKRWLEKFMEGTQLSSMIQMKSLI